VSGNLIDIPGVVGYCRPMISQPKPVTERDEDYKIFIRSLPCSAPNCGASAPSVAHHHPLAGHSGKSVTTSDYRTVPLCVECHIPGVHQQGRLTFWGDLDAVEVMISQLNIQFFTRCL
jgi:hypothetical protein